MKPTIADLEEMARAAGELLRQGYGERHEVDRKGVIDLVTEVDRQSEQLLLEALGKRFPGHRVVAEETGGLPGADEKLWYIDPLDGTVNYAHNLPIFSVSIAYAEGGQTELGVVYDPMREEMFTAQRGEGAFLNRRRLRVSSTAELANSLLVTGFPYDIWNNPDNNLDNFAHFAVRTQGVRRLGSAALDLAYVAAGRLDGFWEIRLSPWDVAAGALIVQEAGGLVTNIEGGEDYLSAPQSILAANPRLHARILEELQAGE